MSIVAFRVALLGLSFSAVLSWQLNADAADAKAEKPSAPRKRVEELLTLGEKNTPGAVEAAKTLYESLRQQTGGDVRIDYAYAVVMVQQHRYADANRQLVALLKTHPNELHSWRLKIWAQMLDKSYDGALADMQRLAKRYPQDKPAAEAHNDEFFHDTAFLCGQFCGFLAGPRASVVKKAELDRAVTRMQEAVGPEYWGSFEEGRLDVQQRYEQAQRELALITAAEKTTAEKKHAGGEKRVALETVTLEKRKSEAQHKAESLEQDWAEIKRNSSTIQSLLDQLAIVDSRASLISSQADIVLQQRQSSTSTRVSGGQRPGLSREEAAGLNSQLAGLNRNAAEIKLQLSVLRARQTALLARQEIEGATLDKRATEIRQASKQLQAAEKKLKYERIFTKSAEVRRLTVEMHSLAAYEEFHPDSERAYALCCCGETKLP